MTERLPMYAIGTAILCGQMGVCRVESIGEPPFQSAVRQPYYKLRSVFSTSGELIYIPVNLSASMRPLIDGGTASGYLDQLPAMDPPIFRSRKPAELTAHYQDMLETGEPRDCLLLIKEIYCKQKELSGHKRKLGQVDSRYLKIAERLVCEEFAAALHTRPDSVKTRLYEAMDCQASPIRVSTADS